MKNHPHENKGLLPQHYDPFGLGRPHLSEPAPQPPLLVVVENHKDTDNKAPPSVKRWMLWLIWTLVLLYIGIFIMSFALQSQSGQKGVIQDPLMLIQQKSRPIR